MWGGSDRCSKFPRPPHQFELFIISQRSSFFERNSPPKAKAALDQCAFIFGSPITATVGKSTGRGGNALTAKNHHLINKTPPPLRPHASPRMSLGDERGSETDDTQRVARFAARSVSPLHHRLRDFRYRNVDASDDSGLGNGYAHDVSVYARIGESMRRTADARAHDGRWFSRGHIRQTQNSVNHPLHSDRYRSIDRALDLDWQHCDLANICFCDDPGRFQFVRNAHPFSA